MFFGVRSMARVPEFASGGLRSGLLFQCTADVEEIVGDDAEPDPTLHSGLALIAAAAEPVSPFDHADASLASGPPFLAIAEPALLLFAFALRALGGAIGNADALDALCLRRHLVLGGVECGVCGNQARNASEPCLMGFDGSDQQVRIAGTPIVDFVVGHNLLKSASFRS